MVEQWAVLNIGCIECGVGSAIVVVLDNQAKAAEIAAILNDKMSWRDGGQNYYEVHRLPRIGVVGEAYQAAIERGDHLKGTDHD